MLLGKEEFMIYVEACGYFPANFSVKSLLSKETTKRKTKQHKHFVMDHHDKNESQTSTRQPNMDQNVSSLIPAAHGFGLVGALVALDQERYDAIYLAMFPEIQDKALPACVDSLESLD
eukprot:1677456-Amphidinium_carterae.2